MKPLNTFLILALAGATSSSTWAASVVVEPFSTSFSGLSADVMTTNGFSADLSDVSGLTGGAPISVRLDSGGDLIWVGGFTTAGAGFEINVTASLVLSVGEQSFEASVSVLDLSIPGDALAEGAGGSSMVSGPVGYSLVEFEPLEVTVPWGTDLSDVRLTLSQNSTVNQGAFIQSEVGFTLPATVDTGAVNFALLTTSVPEPGCSALLISTLAVFFFRRGRERA